MSFITTIFQEFWGTLTDMAPYLLFGFAVAGALSIFISSELVEKHLGGHGIWPILKASLFGVPLPLCSCGVIPVAASLRKHGSSKGATTAFLLSTPQTGVDSIMVTLSLLGPVFAIFRPLAAFITGLFGGSIIEALEPDNADNGQIEQCADECCSHTNQTNKLLKALRHGFIVLPRDIAKPLIIGLVIAGIISAFVPAGFFAETLGTGILAMFVMMLLGIPVYVCATASVPIAAAMILKGVSPGAAMVFLMTGPATNAAAIATIWKMFGKRSALIYLTVVAITAMVSGFALDYIFQINNIVPGRTTMWMLPGWIKITSAVILLAVLGYALFAKHGKEKERDEGGNLKPE
ncbi:SO_0444 family Cu/Zn efflux transporter [Verrucomicrobiota bacterium]